jgi:hypothetical protein
LTPSADKLEAFGEENFAAVVGVLINAFDGAAIFQNVLRQPAVEEQRMAVLISLLNAVRP